MPHSVPRKPHQIRVLEGGRGHHRPMVPDLPSPQGGLFPPKGLSPEERREWDRHVGWLQDLKLDSRVDAASLEGAVRALVLARRCDRALRKGLTYEHGGLVKARPELNQRDKAWRTYSNFAGRFGLSPSDRARLSVERQVDPVGASDTPPELKDASANEPGA